VKPTTLFIALCIVWAISQLWIGRRRSGDRAKTRDRGTLNLLIVTILVSLSFGIWLALRDDGQFATTNTALLRLGVTLMGAGLLVRWWAVRTLAQFFTVDIDIQPGQKLIRSGPYRLLRHPSYTGALLTVLGFRIALGNIVAALLVVVPTTAAFLWRIRIEENMLAAAFPEQYPAYARHTRRLIPYLW